MFVSPGVSMTSRTRDSDTQNPLKILLVEDNTINQKVTTLGLERDGHRVVVVCNGREALEQFQRQAFDLILMDLQMPEMDGYQATRAIREIESETGRHTPIIAFTASSRRVWGT